MGLRGQPLHPANLSNVPLRSDHTQRTRAQCTSQSTSLIQREACTSRGWGMLHKEGKASFQLSLSGLGAPDSHIALHALHCGGPQAEERIQQRLRHNQHHYGKEMLV